MPARLTPEQRRWRSLSERDFQKWVTDLATVYGWTWWHFHDSRRQVRPGVFVGDKDAAGFPDLCLVHPRWNEDLDLPGVLLVELKREGHHPTDVQLASHAALTAARVDVEVWHPSDEARIEAVLSSPQRRINVARG